MVFSFGTRSLWAILALRSHAVAYDGKISRSFTGRKPVHTPQTGIRTETSVAAERPALDGALHRTRSIAFGGSRFSVRKLVAGRGRLLLGGFLVLLVVVGGLGAPWISPIHPASQNLMASLLPPAWMPGGSPEHLLGTDILGRDVFTRLLYGARISLLVGVSSVVVGGFIGTALGLTAGYVGGRTDGWIMRAVDIQLAFPPIFIAIAIVAVIGQNLINLIFVLCIATWVQYARVARASTLAVREQEYVLGAKALGASDLRIVLKHILPNILSPVIVIGAVNISAMIIAEASLSFLGLGVQPPTPTWGGMLAESRDVAQFAWWTVVFPGLAILIAVTGVNLIADAVKKDR